MHYLWKSLLQAAISQPSLHGDRMHAGAHCSLAHKLGRTQVLRTTTRIWEMGAGQL